MTDDQIKSLTVRFPEGIPAWIRALPEAEAIKMMELRREAFPATIVEAK